MLHFTFNHWTWVLFALIKLTIEKTLSKKFEENGEIIMPTLKEAIKSSKIHGEKQLNKKLLIVGKNQV